MRDQPEDTPSPEMVRIVDHLTNKHGPKVIDLMEALKASLADHKAKTWLARPTPEEPTP